MTDTDKILQALARLEAGQRTLQETVSQQGNTIGRLQEGQQTLQKTADQQWKAIVELREGQKTLELKVEAFQMEQNQANIQILTALSNVDEINAQETDKRITRIEKHLSLPPLK